MKRSVLSAIFVILIILSGAAGYFAGLYTPRTAIHQASVTTTSSTSCVVTGPTEGVIIQVLQDSAEVTPVVGAKIGGEDLGYCNNSLQTMILNSTTTNSTGWARLIDGGFGIYYLNIIAFNNNYTLSVPMQPISVTFVTYNISNGNVTTHYCVFCNT